MLKDIKNDPNNKAILLITNRNQHYKHQLNKYNITNYRVEIVNWNTIFTFLATSNYVTNTNMHNNLELIILDISTTITMQDTKFNKLISTIIGEIKKLFSDIRIFFILSSKTMRETFLSKMTSIQDDDIRFQPFSIIDVIDLISITNQKERLERLQLTDHCMHTYSTSEDKINDAIKFLRIGIKNNEATLILLDNDIDLSVFKSHLALDNIDVDNLQNNGSLKIEYSKDWYLSFNQKNNTMNQNKITINNESINRKFFGLLNQVTKYDRKKGLRVFGMTDYFFENDLVDELVDYDCRLPRKYNKPMLSICVYSDKHIKKLSENQIKRLVLTHKKVGFN
ncbi:MAG TPA: MEDS domain-containing protein [Nitrososphaeraceae archaeon]|nr:MEDS domain-containing protein [Nitrososphaeraceae archaeon]